MSSLQTRPTEAFRDEHRHLMVHVGHIRAAAADVGDLTTEERESVIGNVVDFLRGTLLPHAQAEEQVLYPAIGELLGDIRATAVMTRDHVAIGRLVDALAETDASDVARVRELLYGLHALITVHFEKEEEVYLPLLDARPDVAERVVQQAAAHHHHG